MAGDVWFQEDLQRVLTSADFCIEASVAEARLAGASPAEINAFRRGWQSCLAAVALATGVPVELVQLQREEVPRLTAARFRD